MKYVVTILASVTGLIGGIALGAMISPNIGIAFLIGIAGCLLCGWLAAFMYISNDAAANLKKCPQCGENVLKEAVRCKHCQSAI
jgi:predicted RNA-binding Zn-ribbon protein involved in translation (DUF1610 family)